MLLWFLLALLLSIMLFYCYLRLYYGWGSFFKEENIQPPRPLVTDKRARDKVLKQGFAQDKIPPNLDALVIGSGVGGLSAAAALAKAGKRVLVLEQHDQAGGSCHTFQEHGYEFDVESSHQDVVRGLTSNKELQTVFSYLFYGVPPNDSSFMINALLLHHYKRGAWYPRGGSSEIAFHMIPVIERAGGKVLVKAPVKRILLNNGRVTGVAVQRKDKEICIYAPVVISDAGIFNTYEQLLPFVVKKKPEVESLLSSLQYGMGCFLVFIGIRGTSDELGLKSTNLWIYTESDLNSLMEKFQSLEYEEVCKQLPLMFITFPSAKDPTYSQRHPGHSCMTLLTMAPYDWFHQWSDQKPRNRGEEYHTMKMMLANHMVERAIKEFPQLQGKIEYLEAATPVSNEFYLRAPKGSMYGAEQNCSRYQCDIISRMRSQTAVSGLYLTGQDVFSSGVAGAVHGGLLCASAVLNKILYIDLFMLKTRIKKRIKQRCS
ncbi:all-trans-retinol 13,14-reductase-like isoform X2 [Ranitomeya imitator]|uniref:all-trans-retinol 13,14-reductase-like isoform X2 n=1 Tax=Ranitomeya imitator TaxID=111125 RepID=UPI0037E8C22E